MRRRRRDKRGFTLIEILIVLGLIGVAGTAGLTALKPETFLDKSHDAERKADVEEVKTALELYYRDNQREYPGESGSTPEEAYAALEGNL